MIKVKRSRSSRINQGDIFKDIDFIEHISEKKGELEISKIRFPYIIVLSQDCDLEQDYNFRWSRSFDNKNQDKWLLSVLVAPIYNEDHIYSGEHLSELGMIMGSINRNRTDGKKLRNNETPRYHYIEFPQSVPIVTSVIDFKHYFSISVII